MTHKILILGGYGNTGRPLARLLLQYAPSVEVIVAGRNINKAGDLATNLNYVFPGQRVSARCVDASDSTSLEEAFRDVDLVVVASPTSTNVKEVATAALKVGIDYFDIQYAKHKLEYLKSIEPQIQNAGLCFITDGGFHPGLPAALIHYVALSFGTLQQANVGSVIQIDWNGLDTLSPETMEEFASEFLEIEMLAYKIGSWKDVGMRNMLDMDFGEPFGKRSCIPMFLEEMRAIPTLYPDLSETGFYVGGFHWIVDWLVVPIVMVGVKLWPTKKMKQTMGKFLYYGLRKCSKPPYGTLLKVEARGITKEGASEVAKTVTVQHIDGYEFTAIPVVATLLQYLAEKNSIRKPGLWFQANIVDPKLLFEDMTRMGVEVSED